MTELTLKQTSRKSRDLNREASYLFDNFTDRIIGVGTLGNVLPVSTDTATNCIRTPQSTLYCTNIATQTLLCPTNAATGLDIAGDQTASDGFEINFQEPGQTDARFLFTIGSEPVGFFMEALVTVADVSGAAELLFGFRKNATVEAARATYTDYALIGLIRSDIEIATDLDNAGETLTDTTMDASDTIQCKFRIEVDSDGNVTYKVANTAALVASGAITPTVSADYTFNSGDVVVPCIRLIQHADLTGTCVINSLEIGYLN